MKDIDELSVEDYVEAFNNIEITENQRKMLEAHLQASNYTVTATILCSLIGFPSYTSINLQYGRLAGKLCEYLRVKPKDVNIEVLVEFFEKRRPGEDIQWPLRANVVKALQSFLGVEEIEESIWEELDNFIKIHPTKIDSTTKTAIIESRLGQGLFRNLLIDCWHGCSVTGCEEILILRASHIKPWRNSTNEERLDPYNGLLLIPNLDAAFDQGFISFEDDGSIIISNKVISDSFEKLGITEDMKINGLNRKHFRYLKYLSAYFIVSSLKRWRS